MPLNINTNAAASSASYHLSKNNAALQKSLTRLSSGSRITQPADDAGGLAVSMKLSGTINRLSGVEKNIDNAISFLQVQDGILDSAGKILDRMAELKALSQDVLKNASDIANYNSEFQNLQVQLHQMSQTTFNGVSLAGAGTTAIFGGSNTQDVTVSIFTSATGESGSKVSINKTMLLSALTIDASDLTSASFTDAGKKDKPSKTPKTDVKGDRGQRISLKKKGGSQIMSAKRIEAFATLEVAFQKFGENESSELKKVFNTLKTGVLDTSKSGYKGTIDTFKDKVKKLKDDGSPQALKELEAMQNQIKDVEDATQAGNVITLNLNQEFSSNPKLKEALQKTLFYFENEEEYEKCAILKKYLDFLNFSS